jgi:maltooligosyltrehalose trehalohydrolase
VHDFRVWAPAARRVDLVLADRRLSMEATGGGWWTRAVDLAGPGSRYAFSLDGGPPRPDPRSASQPDGIDTPSEVVDHGAFVWRDAGWRGPVLAGSVLYELHVGTFTPRGTFDAVIDRLPHLVGLGVDAIELLPVAEFSGARGWGYDGVQLFAPHHAYGGPAGLKRLVDACHAAGIGVVMDVVYNHFGPAGCHLPEFGPYLTDRHHTGWGDAVNFDGPGSAEVRAFAIDNARMWLRDYHCDGLRLDAVHAIVDDSPTHILEELAAAVDELAAHLRRPLFVIAESDQNDPRLVRSRDCGGFGLAASWADDWHHALHTILTDERGGYYEDFGSLEQLAKAIRQAWVYDGVWSPHRRRPHGQSPAGLPGHRFVVATQNHDQVGNRAAGERLAALTSPGRLAVAAALLLTSPFVPMLFQGEEWAASTPFQYFTDHRDPTLGDAVSRGRRAEFAAFGWDPERVPDPQHAETWARSKLDWHEPGAGVHADVLAWYRSLIALRRRTPALTDGRTDRVDVEADAARGTLVVVRGPVTVAVNLGAAPVALPVGARRAIVAASASGVEAADGGVRLPPDSVAVLVAS